MKINLIDICDYLAENGFKWVITHRGFITAKLGILEFTIDPSQCNIIVNAPVNYYYYYYDKNSIDTFIQTLKKRFCYVSKK